MAHQEGWAKHLGIPAEITNSIRMKLKLIPPGQFEMGSPKELIDQELKTAWGLYREMVLGEGPRHEVRITKPFYLGKYLVTQEEYESLMGLNPSSFCASGDRKDAVGGLDTKLLSGGASVLGRGGGVLSEAVGLACREGRPSMLSAADGGPVGVCLSCGEYGPVVFQRSVQSFSAGSGRKVVGRVCPVEYELRRETASCGREAS